MASLAPTASGTSTTRSQSTDWLTVVCIAVISYLVASVVHEGLGHAGAALFLGARNVHFSTAAENSDTEGLADEALRIISIAGPMVGLIVGGLLALLHARTRSGSAELRYCLWLTGYVCLFANSGYFLALSFANFGDINSFLSGVEHSFWWRLILTLLGTGVYVAVLFAARRTVDEFIGVSNRRARAVRLLLPSYLAGSAALIGSTLLGNQGVFLTLVSAAPATLGGTIGIPYTVFFVGEARPTTKPVPLTPQRSWVWYGAGVIAVIILALVLGPGVPR